MSKKGTSDFIVQRFTAVVMAVTVSWFLISLVSHIGDTRVEAIDWLTRKTFNLPLNAICLGTLTIAMCFHMRIGVNEIIEDYIHTTARKSFLMFLNSLFALAVGIGNLVALIALNLV